MFDDITQKEQANSEGQAGFPSRPDPLDMRNASVDGKKAVEDIFSEIESTDNSPFKKVQPGDAGYSGVPATASKSMMLKKIMIIVGILCGLAMASAAGYWGYKYVVDNVIVEKDGTVIPEAAVDNAANANVPAGIPDTAGIPAGNPAPEEAVMTPLQPDIIEPPAGDQVPVMSTDTDQDGLTDEEELSLGTKIDSPDSDADGLFDREEVMVYKTDPLNADTDGDGYKDGEEVANKFNPKGAGKLFPDLEGADTN